MFFVGLSVDFFDHLFAFGQIAAIDNGPSVARAIVEGADNDKLLSNWIRRNKDQRIMRRYVDKFSDDDFDKAMRIIKTPFFRTLASRSNVNLVNILSRMAKVMVSHKIDRTIT